MSLPKYKYLLTYRIAEIIHDLTVEFCKIYLNDLDNLGRLRTIPQRRTIDQMVQAARSGKQNIVEGVGQSQTSKKGEIKLLGVSKASLEELLTDYEDFLRQRKLPIWSKTDEKVTRLKHYTYRISHISNLSPLGHLKEKPKLPLKEEVAANLLLILTHQGTYLLDRQIAKADETFVKEGGFTENLFNRRVKEKLYNKSPRLPK